jgi:hypothetical protein
MRTLRTLLLLALVGSLAGCYYYPGSGYGYGGYGGGYGGGGGYGYGPPPGPVYGYGGPSVNLDFGFFGCCYGGGWHHHRW